MPTPTIEVRDIWKSFGETPVLRGVSLSVAQGEVAVVIGRSGSGKSTLLRCINYLAPPNRGEVWIGGKPFGAYRASNGKTVRQGAAEIHRTRARMPMVFQRFNLFQNFTALGN